MSRREPRTRVGRYAVYGAIASGGMASVHWGRLVGEKGFARVVAVKRLHPQYADNPDFTTMLLDEARIVARIRHPNVVPTLDVVSADGELLLVMEYVHGEAFSRLLRAARDAGKSVPPKIAASIVCGVLEGLHAAHEATDEKGSPLGIVHRDVTPHNVLVGVDGAARIVDFGVARAAGRMQGSTRDGALKGKIPYMSPEQIRAQGVDRRTDVYAAGVVLWEALVGARAFDADSDVAVMAKVLDTELPPPSTRVPSLPKDADGVLAKALARSRDERFQTARDMAIALEEAFGVASPREVAAWVQELAGDAIAERARVLAAVEADDLAASDPGIPAFGPPLDETKRLPLGRTPVASPGVEPVSKVTTLTSSSPSSRAEAPFGRPRRGRIVGMIVAAVAVTSAIAALALSGSDRTEARQEAPKPAPSRSVEAPAPTPSEVAPPASASAEPVASAPPASTSAHPAHHPHVDCTNPFWKSADGILHPRPECLR